MGFHFHNDCWYLLLFVGTYLSYYNKTCTEGTTPPYGPTVGPLLRTRHSGSGAGWSDWRVTVLISESSGRYLTEISNAYPSNTGATIRCQGTMVVQNTSACTTTDVLVDRVHIQSQSIQLNGYLFRSPLVLTCIQYWLPIVDQAAFNTWAGHHRALTLMSASRQNLSIGS